MSEATCEACGEPNAPYAEFCIACGSYLGWQDRRPAGEPAPAEPGGDTTLPGAGPAGAGWGGAGRGGAGAADPRPAGAGPAEPRPADPKPTDPKPTDPKPTDPTPAPDPAHRAQPPCPACGTPNPPDRHFCRKCGAVLAAGAGPPLPPAPPARPGWRRFLPGNAARSRARSAYRRSLPMRYHVTRALAGVTAIATVAGLLSLAGHNPVGWLRDRWYAVRGTLTPVSQVTAKADPATATIDGYLPGFAVDQTPDQAWATTWARGGSTGTTCRRIPHGEGASLVLTLPQKTTLRGVEVAAGLPAADPHRVLQWRPRLLQLTSDDGTCQRVELADKDGLQRRALRPVSTASVRVEIAAALPPRSGADPHVAIGEIRLLRRPG